jgi:hypothetical protein
MVPGVFAILGGALFALASLGPVSAASVSRLAFFGFGIINTSLEATTAAEIDRLQMLGDLLIRKLSTSGQFEVIPITPDIRSRMAQGAAIQNCNGCERDYALQLNAQKSAYGTVQKVSNLILNINLRISDVGSGEVIFARSVDIRGNTWESWMRGLTYMLDNYLLKAK